MGPQESFDEKSQKIFVHTITTPIGKINVYRVERSEEETARLQDEFYKLVVTLLLSEMKRAN